MVVLSMLRPSIQRGIGVAAVSITRKQALPLLKSADLAKVVKRYGSRKMIIMPSKFTTNVFWDQVHFFLFLAYGPIFTVVILTNVLIGPAELRDIPEGYEPKEYEYIKYPIQRFFQKYWYESLQKEYERNLAILKIQDDRKTIRKIERKIANLQDERQDYRGWYYVPIDSHRIKVIEEQRNKIRNKDF